MFFVAFKCTVHFLHQKFNRLSSQLYTVIKYRNISEETERCFKGLGCYSNEYPWLDVSRPVSIFPNYPEKVAPSYCLYTRKNPKQCQHLSHSEPSSIIKSFLVPTQRTYFVTHGFLEGGDRPWIRVSALDLSDYSLLALIFRDQSIKGICKNVNTKMMYRHLQSKTSKM